MSELLQQYWIFIAFALVLGLLVAFWVFHLSRRTTVKMEEKPDGGAAIRNQALIDAAPAAPAAPVQPTSDRLAAAADELGRIKGVGPKLAAILREQGVTSLAQIAAWDDAEIDRIDAQLGRFAGRIRRDDWVEQARLLAAADIAGYEARFGKL